MSTSGIAPVAGSRRPNTVSCFGFSSRGSAPVISILRTVPFPKTSVDALIVDWAGTPALVPLFCSFGPRCFVLIGESPIKLRPQFSQKTTPGRLRNEQVGQTCMNFPFTLPGIVPGQAFPLLSVDQIYRNAIRFRKRL